MQLSTAVINLLNKISAAEWESLYQPIPLKQMMADTLAEEAEKVEVRRQREVKIQENLAKMESQLEAWRHRVSAKNRSAEGDRLRREKVNVLQQ